MSYGHSIDPGRRFIYQVYEGYFPVALVIACTKRLWADPAYSNSYHGIVDVSRMTTDGGITEIQTLISFLRTQPATATVRWAAITTSPVLTAASMLYRTAMSGRHTLEILATWESASNALQIDLLSPPPVTFFPDLAGAPTPAAI